MIPATHITPFVDDLAWLVFKDNEYQDVTFQWDMLDRLCDACGGQGFLYMPEDGLTCLDCRGSKRHCLDIEVEDPICVKAWPDGCNGDYDPRCCRFPKSCSRYPHTLTVSVVPGMVLPIHPDLGAVPDTHHVRVTGGGIAWLAERINNGGWRHTMIDLPSAAEPGMWAVQLRRLAS